MNRAPWEYLLIAFNPKNFSVIDLNGKTVFSFFDLTWQISLGLLVAGVLFYNFQGRRLRNYAVFLDLNEWLLWTGVAVFGLLLMFATFNFDFIFVLPTMIGGALLFLWIRFIHFPPLIDAYEQRLARQRYFQRARTSHPESTIRSKSGAKAKRRRH